VVDAEQAFARAARERGTRSAFLEYLSEDAVIFRPEPVNGRQWYLDQTETGALLSWEPVVADISRAGDLGYTTGPWEYTSEGNEGAPEIFGHYVSVWRKQSDGKWRVVVDVGTPHPKPDGSSGLLRVSDHREEKDWSPRAGDDPKRLRSLLMRAESEFSSASGNRGRVSAYTEYAADDVRLYRSDAFPVTGNDNVRRALHPGGRTVRSHAVAAETSASGDLGYTYGSNTVATGDSAGSDEPGVYFRIWRRTAIGSWKIIIDVWLPNPVVSDESEE
jgi:ketosteroid isomerase-like protein